MTTRRAFLALSSCAIGHALTESLSADDHGLLSRNYSLTESARGVAVRLLGVRAEEFTFETIPAENGLSVFEVTASQGRVTVGGSSAVAVCRGLYTYLREACNAMVTWSGRHLDLPPKFPNYKKTRVVSPYRVVQYYNVCAFGYSTPFWNWDRWERELDWMALHGINMPMAMEGQEFIWQKVWKKLGASQSELDRFSCGPAHLPWHRMGNINYFDGPLPQIWIEQKRDLQKKLLQRMRELGMFPIVPAFSGFVPEAFKRLFPQAGTFTELWTDGMPRLSKTLILDPHEADLYREIGKRFISEYQQEFGRTEYYLADTFNELRVPVRLGHQYEDLAQFGRTVFDAIIAGDPKGKWVMQGWLFRSDPQFWDNKAITAFLSKIPDDRMVIIDFSNDWNAVKFRAGDNPVAGDEWKYHGSFFGKQWINGMVHTFGGNNNVKGNLPLIVAQPANVRASPDKGNLIGWGMDPEGIENNEAVYELMTDIGWSCKIVDLDIWIPAYCRSRYGDYPLPLAKAWRLLLNSAYSWHPTWNSRHAWQCRPTLDPTAESVETGSVFQQAVDLFLSCADQFKSNTLYRNDLIELVAQSAGGHIDRRLLAACTAHKAGQADARDRMAKEALDMLLRIDALMHVRPDRRLETWTAAARSWGVTPDEVAYLDANCRRIITFWGWSGLNDYASRVWSGLIRDYYVGRWQAFFQGLQDEKNPSNLDVWEETWLSSPYSPSIPVHVDDIDAEAKQMLEVCKGWA